MQITLRVTTVNIPYVQRQKLQFEEKKPLETFINDKIIKQQ